MSEDVKKYKMTIHTELPNGKMKKSTVICTGYDAVERERAHQRTLKPAGSTQVIEVHELKR